MIVKIFISKHVPSRRNCHPNCFLPFEYIPTCPSPHWSLSFQSPTWTHLLQKANLSTKWDTWSFILSFVRSTLPFLAAVVALRGKWALHWAWTKAFNSCWLLFLAFEDSISDRTNKGRKGGGLMNRKGGKEGGKDVMDWERRVWELYVEWVLCIHLLIYRLPTIRTVRWWFPLMEDDCRSSTWKDNLLVPWMNDSLPMEWQKWKAETVTSEWMNRMKKSILAVVLLWTWFKLREIG